MNSTTRFIDNVLIARYGLLTDGLELDLIVPYWIHGEVKSDFGMAQSIKLRMASATWVPPFGMRSGTSKGIDLH